MRYFIKRKRKIILMMLLLLSFFQCGCDSLQKRVVYDSEYDKQWYLQNNYTGDFLLDPNEKGGKGGFQEVISSVHIESNLDLGIDNIFESDVSEKELTIALIDSCVDINHEDLKSHIWKNEKEVPNNNIDDDENGYIDDYYGWNFIDNSNCVNNYCYEIEHGTHCAGIIAAAHNGKGIMGILGNTNVRLMILPILNSSDNDKNNEKTIHRLLRAIQYAENMGANICSLSCTFGTDLNEIRTYIKNSSMYFVVAAGNYESNLIKGIDLDKRKRYPACYNYENVITVGSVNEKQEISSFSGYSKTYVNIVAPGEYVYSTGLNDTYIFKSGSSMSTAIVTGMLGAYYLNQSETLKEATKLLYKNAVRNSKLSNQVCGGMIVYYQ